MIVKMAYAFSLIYLVYMTIAIPFFLYTCQFSWQSKFGLFLYKKGHVFDIVVKASMLATIPFIVCVFIVIKQ
jgi:hypothetical protein